MRHGLMKFRPLTLATLAPLATVTLLAACGDTPPELPYGTAQLMMANEVQPTADIYWASVGSASELVDGEPVFREWAPETDEEWQAVADSAVKLRTLGEALATPAYAEGRGEAWMDYANGLQEAATAAEQAALNHSADEVFEAGGNLYAVCSACHQAYPPEEAPEGETVEDMSTQ